MACLRARCVRQRALARLATLVNALHGPPPRARRHHQVCAVTSVATSTSAAATSAATSDSTATHATATDSTATHATATDSTAAYASTAFTSTINTWLSMQQRM